MGKPMVKGKLATVFEVVGSALAIVYALLIASNTGNELLGFSILLVSSFLFAGWALLDRRCFLSLQFFYVASAIIGLVRWAPNVRLDTQPGSLLYQHDEALIRFQVNF